MTKRVRFRQADVARLVRGALKGGLQADGFTIEVTDGKITLLPSAAAQPLSEAERVERLMVEAFGR